MPESFKRLPTAAKLLLLILLALLPLGLLMVWAVRDDIHRANTALEQRAEDQGASVARAIEGLIARNALALRVAANGALAVRGANDCEEARQSLAIAPGVSRSFSLESPDAEEQCATSDFVHPPRGRLPQRGGIAVWLDPTAQALFVRVAVAGGVATDRIALAEIAAAAHDVAPRIGRLTVDDGVNSARLIGNAGPTDRTQTSLHPIASDQLNLRIAVPLDRLSATEWLLLMLPMGMWLAAGVISWWLVNHLLIHPLRRLERAIATHDPQAGPFTLPRRMGPAIEIGTLGQAFQRAIVRIESSEREMSAALEGQRRLVREVHHRVKNNLQVVASLLSIHGRNAEGADGRAAYAAIGRRVDALAVVHRNHYAEGEANRGIALRPLLTELAGSLRSSAPEPARRASIQLDVDAASTTQDVAVAVAFLVTEVVEFALLRRPDDLIAIEVRRSGELTARLTIESAVLTDGDAADRSKAQFDRVVTGLARQLRSSLETRLGRLSVELPVFPV